ncbi:hypothetical protein CONPUDRAFT_142242 [Coniophora puteana RWD-64-598 SS2]|uniref:DUF6533 domain-containing protein n=1 Tax=Coniophora puteana (strain RWD-64-598) TaxID=741705 RepID=A0A5M3MWP7_CONPW|nr:uncharacterized protein CONPUDRAFT_142242 [Coniophora puteana RWD-64-598 SS2]EIW83568.1 hypothetical protein CONPUDRAFT_142242 [Coniophora puteana RWD-64-598 SS2]
MFALRAYIMWNGSKAILVALSGLISASFITALALLMLIMPSVEFAQFGTSVMPGCIKIGASSVVCIVYAIVIVIELALLILTIARIKKSSRKAKSGILATMIRDGIVYGLCMFRSIMVSASVVPKTDKDDSPYKPTETSHSVGFRCSYYAKLLAVLFELSISQMGHRTFPSLMALQTFHSLRTHQLHYSRSSSRADLIVFAHNGPIDCSNVSMEYHDVNITLGSAEDDKEYCNYLCFAIARGSALGTVLQKLKFVRQLFDNNLEINSTSRAWVPRGAPNLCANELVDAIKNTHYSIEHIKCMRPGLECNADRAMSNVDISNFLQNRIWPRTWRGYDKIIGVVLDDVLVLAHLFQTYDGVSVPAIHSHGIDVRGWVPTVTMSRNWPVCSDQLSAMLETLQLSTIAGTSRHYHPTLMEQLHQAATGEQTLNVYDLLINVSEEIEYLWMSHEFGLGKLLFVFTRYLPVISLPLALSTQFAPISSSDVCSSIMSAVTVFQVAEVAVSEYLFMLRTYILWNCGKVAFFVLGSLAISASVSVIAILILFVPTEECWDGSFNACYNSKKSALQ